jgi:predicted DNA-binding protein
MAAEPTTTLYARIPIELKELLDKRCKEEERTLAVMVGRAIKHFLACDMKPIETTDRY